MAQAAKIPNLAEEVKKKISTDSFAAVQWINSLGEPKEVCEIYDQAVRDLYWSDKGAANLVTIGRAGINFCLGKSKESEAIDQKRAEEFKAQAKTIAFDVASNSWRGWGDEGVTIARTDMEAGLDAAKLNLRLAFELKKPDDKVAIAYWLLSAMQLAFAQYETAGNSIDQAILYAKKTKDATQTAFCEGFKGLIQLSSGNLSAGQTAFDAAILELKTIANDDAKGYIGQLETAKKIFVKHT